MIKKKKIGFWRQLAVRQAIVVFIVAIVVGFCFGSLQLYLNLQESRNNLRETTRQVVNMVRQPALDAVYKLDSAVAQEIANGLFEYEIILGVKILDDLGEVLVEKSRQPKRGEARWIADTLFGGQEVVLEKLDGRILNIDVAGDLQVTYDSYEAADRFLQSGKTVVFSGLLRTLFLAAILYTIFHLTVTRPFKQVIQGLVQIDSKNPLNHMFDSRVRSGDEFNLLFTAINQVLRALNSEIEDHQIAATDLRRIRDELEERVQARTSDLERAKQEAEVANRSKSEFLARMSHDLRTPLNAIIGLSEMLTEDAEIDGNQDLLEPLTRIGGAGNHLLSLINDILDLAKVEAGKLKFHNARFEIVAVLNYLERTSVTLADKNNNHFVVSAPVNLGTMFADRVRVEQVLFNLISNACKFTSGGKIELSVSRDGSDGVDSIMFNLSDTGIGMSTEQLAIVFSEYSQADDDTGHKYGGTGLGLAICKRLVGLMNGSISAVSEPDKGSIFTVRLPLEADVGALSDEVDV